MSVLNEISQALQKGNARLVAEKTQEALNSGIEPGMVLSDGLIAGMNIIGVKFKNGDIYVPEVMMSAKAMGMGMNVLKPKLEETGVKPFGKVVLGTVKGDLHILQVSVGMMMAGSG
jgi:5-methyltetrahydrofolate--homocysteine methyltransferase